MAWWPFGRDRRQSTPGLDPADPAAVAAGTPRDDAGWTQLPPMQRSLVGPVTPVTATTDFRAGLAAHTDPSFLAPLAHQLDPAGGGIADGLAALVPGRPQPWSDLTELSVPSRPDATGPGPRVQRQPVTWSGPAGIEAGAPSEAQLPGPALRRVEAVPEQLPRAGVLPAVQRRELPVASVAAPEGGTLPAGAPLAVHSVRRSPDPDRAPVVDRDQVADATPTQAPLSGFAAAISALNGAGATDPGQEVGSGPDQATASPPVSPPPRSLQPAAISQRPAVQRTAISPPPRSASAAGQPGPDLGPGSAGTSGGEPSPGRVLDPDPRPSGPPAPLLGDGGVLRGDGGVLREADPIRPLSSAPGFVGPAPATGTEVVGGSAPLASVGLLRDRPLPVQRRTDGGSRPVPERVQRAVFLPPAPETWPVRPPGGLRDPASAPPAVQRATADGGEVTPAGTARAAAHLARPDPTRLNPLALNPLSSDPLSSDPLSFDPASPVHVEPGPTVSRELRPVAAEAGPQRGSPGSSPGPHPGSTPGVPGAGAPRLAPAAAPPVVLRQRAVESAAGGSAGGTPFARMFGSRPGSGSIGEPGPSVQRETGDAEPQAAGLTGEHPGAAETPGASAPAAGAPSAPAGAPGAAPGAAPSAEALEEMARRLYEPLSARLRAELWLDRERSGLMTDVH